MNFNSLFPMSVGTFTSLIVATNISMIEGLTFACNWTYKIVPELLFDFMS